MSQIQRLLKEAAKVEHLLDLVDKVEKDLRWWTSECRRITAPQTPPPRP
jgi:hypothetical protein